MKPILYDYTETAFTSLGLGVLSDAVSCTVRRVLNGLDELEMTYPDTGLHAEEILTSRIIFAAPEHKKNAQPYRIYDVQKQLNGLMAVYARHIREQLSYIPVEPFSAGTAAAVLAGIPDHALETCPFTFTTSKLDAGAFSMDAPASIMSILGGPVLDLYGGEYDFDRYTVTLLGQLGADRGVSIRYGKNLTDARQEEAIDAVVTGVCPYWADREGNRVTLSEKIVYSSYASAYPFNRTIVHDFSGDFDSQPTEAQLRTAAQAYVNSPGVGVPKISLQIAFEHLAQYEEYKDYAVLETVNLGDTVHVFVERLGIDVTARVAETRYDVLRDKYAKITLGSIKPTLSTTLQQVQKDAKAGTEAAKTFLEQAIDHATEVITGAKDGYLVDIFDANNVRTGMMILDNNNPAQAQDVWLYASGGIGHSSTGINGPFTTAITQDGWIVGDRIAANSIAAAKLDIADLQAIGAKIANFTIALNSIYNGKASLTDANPGVYIGTDGVSLGAGSAFKVTDAGAMDASNVNITGGSVTVTGTDAYDAARIAISYLLYGEGTFTSSLVPVGLEVRVAETNARFWLHAFTENAGLGYGSGLPVIQIDSATLAVDRLITALGDLSKTGKEDHTSNRSSNYVSLTSGTYDTLASKPLPNAKGRYLLIATAVFTSNQNGTRAAVLTDSATGTDADALDGFGVVSVRAVSGMRTIVQVQKAVIVGSGGATYYLRGMQDSGGALTAWGNIQYIQIA